MKTEQRRRNRGLIITPTFATLLLGGCSSMFLEGSPQLDQGYQELLALHSCYSNIRDKDYQTSAQCSDYAQMHIPILKLEKTKGLGQGAALTTCKIAIKIKNYLLKDYPDRANVSKLKALLEKDCEGQEWPTKKTDLAVGPFENEL